MQPMTYYPKVILCLNTKQQANPRSRTDSTASSKVKRYGQRMDIEFSLPDPRAPREAFFLAGAFPRWFSSASARALALTLAPVPIVRVTVDTPSTNFVLKITLALENIPSCYDWYAWKEIDEIVVKAKTEMNWMIHLP